MPEAEPVAPPRETEIHPMAVVAPGARLGTGVTVGPFCTVGAEVELGDGVTLISHVAVAGRTAVCARTRIFPFASIGHEPQDLKYRGEASRLEIGDDCLIREGVTMNPGTAGGGLETVVGEGGHTLTAAQSQQLALARLVLLDPPVAVLDEATAEAGSSGARALEGAAAAATAGRTVLVVAHRLTQAATADRIIVMEHGSIVESGPHAELIAAGGRYAELWAAWDSRGSSLEPAARSTV